MTEKNPV